MFMLPQEKSLFRLMRFLDGMMNLICGILKMRIISQQMEHPIGFMLSLLKVTSS